ncbi:MAG: nucleotide exchange factor GrpE [Armatimonadota bacterium]
MARKSGKKKSNGVKVRVEGEEPKALEEAPAEARASATEGQDPAGEDAARADEHEEAGEQAPGVEEQLAQARQAAQEAHNNYLYAVAELQNARRRFQKELADRQQFANEQIISSLLPILDDLERAVAASRQGGDVEGLQQGVEMILKQCHEVLGRFGVGRIEVGKGDTFDPHRHEVAESVADESVEEGTILEVVRPGYQLHGRVLRPAQVKATARKSAEEG